MDITTVNAGLTSFNTLRTLIQSLVGVRDENLIRDKIAQIKEELFVLYDRYTLLQAKHEALTTIERNLKEEIMSLKAWAIQKERYILTELRKPPYSVFAYTLKDSERNAEPFHHICATCFENGKKSILQTVAKTAGMDIALVCYSCGTEIYISGGWRPEHSGKKPR